MTEAILFPRAIRTLIVVKEHGRLHIKEFETGVSRYSPPEFIRVISRQELKDLADAMMEAQFAGRPDIDAIMTYETAARRK
jgi:hypothetical protein